MNNILVDDVKRGWMGKLEDTSLKAHENLMIFMWENFEHSIWDIDLVLKDA